jgi:hypothetical protein
MSRSLRRMAVAVLLALPGIGLAFVAKPLILGEGALRVGILLALAIPVCWLIATGSSPVGGEPSEGKVVAGLDGRRVKDGEDEDAEPPPPAARPRG